MCNDLTKNNTLITYIDILTFYQLFECIKK